MANDIENSINELVSFLRKKGKVKISEAAEFLGINQKHIEPLLSLLEDRGVIEVKYPVMGEPQVVIKCAANEKIEIMPEELKEIEKSEPESELKEIIKAEIKGQNNILNIKLEKLEGEMNDLSNNVEISIFKEDLAEILLIINGLKDIKKISFYLKEVVSLVHKMKEKKVWSKENSNFVITMLRDIAQNWKDYGNNEIANMFEKMGEKIETV